MTRTAPIDRRAAGWAGALVAAALVVAVVGGGNLRWSAAFYRYLR